mmetsp:Transcript_34707/g.48107  ORF Transcript_34707/g.48107 Transcript_34707/m.48107 type:complete len:510 (+) Transcript_34707:60-1589(+)
MGKNQKETTSTDVAQPESKASAKIRLQTSGQITMNPFHSHQQQSSPQSSLPQKSSHFDVSDESQLLQNKLSHPLPPQQKAQPPASPPLVASPKRHDINMVNKTTNQHQQNPEHKRCEDQIQDSDHSSIIEMTTKSSSLHITSPSFFPTPLIPSHPKGASEVLSSGDKFPSTGTSGVNNLTRSCDNVFNASRTGHERGSWLNIIGRSTEDSRLEKKEENMEDVVPESSSAERWSPQKGPSYDIDELDDEQCRRHPRVHVKDDFSCMELVQGRDTPDKGRTRTMNSVSGLELHYSVLGPLEQARLVQLIHQMERDGQLGRLRGRTFTAPRKWMKGKGRVTIQFGCVYNYARDRQGRAPGIITDEQCEDMPDILQKVVQRLVRWGIIPKHLEPDSAIINLYSKDDCIPPHIDHHDFVRPFCSLSLLSEQPIQFGYRMAPAGPGEFSSAFKLSLPPGSVLVLKGNGADVAKHCVPAVSCPRISITFRRMADTFRERLGLPIESRPVPRHGSRW